MDSIDTFTTALGYEENIRDLYREAAATIDDERGKAIFSALAEDEQNHINFLNYSIDQLRARKGIDIDRLQTSIPDKNSIEPKIERMKSHIPEKMLGNVKTVLNSALKMEKETSDYYRQAISRTEGDIQKIFKKFLEIEIRHEEVVQIELDHASNNGIWFDFMEIDLEAE
jgi:rubrerythrin